MYLYTLSRRRGAKNKTGYSGRIMYNIIYKYIIRMWTLYPPPITIRDDAGTYVPHFHSLPLAHVCRWFLYIFFVEPKSAAPAADRAKRTTADEEVVTDRGGFTGEPWGGGRSAVDGRRKFNGGKIIYIYIYTRFVQWYIIHTLQYTKLSSCYRY